MQQLTDNSRAVHLQQLGLLPTPEGFLLHDLFVGTGDIARYNDAQFAELLKQLRYLIATDPEKYGTPELVPDFDTPPAAMNTDLQLVTGSMELIKQVPQLLSSNQATLAQARLVVNNFTTKVTAAGGALTAELDTEANGLIVRIKTGIDNMKARREPFTQIVSKISKMFTGLEAEVLQLQGEVQPLRDKYAQKVLADERARNLEAARKLAEETAINQVKLQVSEQTGVLLSGALFARKEQWQTAFNLITLADFEEKAAKLRGLATAYNPATLPAIFDKLQVRRPFELTEDLFIETLNEAKAGYDFTPWLAQYAREMAEQKDALVARLDSKKKELEALKAAADLQEKEAAEAAAREVTRQAALKTAADEQQRQRLLEQQENERKEDLRRQDEMKQQAAALQLEKQNREKLEADNLAKQKQENDSKVVQEAGVQHAGAQALSLFNGAGAAMPVAKSSARLSWTIEILHPAGLVEIFTFWYQKEGVNLPIPESRKKSVDQMIAFAEGLAKSSGEKIKSANVQYTETAKAINRNTAAKK